MNAKHLLTAICLTTPPALHAQTLVTLYNFSGKADGGDPVGGVVYRGGYLYGEAALGGDLSCTPHDPGCGTLFKVNAAAGGETLLHIFRGGSDGEFPSAAMIFKSGRLYGDTVNGGSSNFGTVFSFNPGSRKVRVLYDFGNGGGADGSVPQSTLVAQGGMLWGTTTYRGHVFACGTLGCGTIFKVNPATFTQSVVYSFAGGQADGMMPFAGLTYHDGFFYGTTAFGGASDAGIVYALNASTNAEGVLHNFTGGADGAAPYAALLYLSGRLFGTTTAGGVGFGTVFSIDPSTGTETTLHQFAGGAADGAHPYAALIYVKGLLFGTTAAGGSTTACNAKGCGTIFSIDPQSKTETMLHSFSGPDGANPVAPLSYEAPYFYGTTSKGGAHCGGATCGTVFRFAPS